MVFSGAVDVDDSLGNDGQICEYRLAGQGLDDF
jgi:hypothetical protein